MWLAQEFLVMTLAFLAALPWTPVLLQRRLHPLEWLGLAPGLAYVLLMGSGYLALKGASGPVLVGLLLCVGVAGLWLARRQALVAVQDGVANAGLVTAAACVVVLLSLVHRAHYTLKLGPWPPGFDPKFHLALVRSMLVQGGIPLTFAPFEAIHVNYPWGGHLAVIAGSTITGLAPHHAFSAHNGVVLGWCSVAAVLFFTWRWTGHVATSIAAAAAYGQLMHFGGADYLFWGGLPNQGGMALMVTAYGLMDQRDHTPSRRLAAFLLGMAFLVHHHVMLTAIAVLGFHGLVEAWARQRWQPLLDAARWVGLALLWASPVTMVIVWRLAEAAQKSGALAYREPYEWDWLSLVKDMPGTPALALCVAGVLVMPKVVGRRPLAPLAFLTSLVVLFAVCADLWQVVSRLLTGTAVQALTPSRFLTDAAYPIASLAGAAVAAVLAGPRPWLRLLAVAPLFLAEPWMWMQHRASGADRPKTPAVEAALRIAKGLPASAAVVEKFQADEFCPYVLGVECMRTPRPVSEPRPPNQERKQLFQKGVLNGAQDVALRRDLFGDRPVFILKDGPLPKGAVEMLVDGPLHLGLIPPPEVP